MSHALTVLSKADYTEVYVNSATQIAVALVTVLGSVLVIGLPMWVARHRDKKERKEQRAILADVRNHVSNDHATNLRDDIDELTKLVNNSARTSADILGELLSLRRDLGALEGRTDTIETAFEQHRDATAPTAASPDVPAQ